MVPRWKLCLLLYCLVLSLPLAGGAKAQPGDQVDGKTRCPVCGMFVAKYKPWVSQLQMSDGEIFSFDGVKDMMAYYFSPEAFGGKDNAEVTAVYVRDYYSQQWIDGRKAKYVVGSDVYGPMGHELIPFETMPAAENFLKDHHGKRIHSFSEINEEMIDAMRKGHIMK